MTQAERAGVGDARITLAQWLARQFNVAARSWQNSAMFEFVVAPIALRQLRQLRRVDGVRILDAVETHLRYEPERPTTAIKQLRGRQNATLSPARRGRSCVL
jgi:hypothetical protein